MRVQKRNWKTGKLCLLLCLLLLLQGCGEGSGEGSLASQGTSESLSETLEQVYGEPIEDVRESREIEDVQESETEEEPPAFQEYEISLMAVGDNLMHLGVINAGKQGDGSYDYSFLFDGIREFLEMADLKIINQETILGGNEKGFTGYPSFNSPTQVGDAIAGAGFNVVLHATNHSADQGIEGMENCIEFWQTHPEVLMVGLHMPYEEESAGNQEIAGEAQENSGENQEFSSGAGESETENVRKTEDGSRFEGRIPLLTVKGVTFAILNYTYGPNYSTVPKKVTDRLEVLCAINEKTRELDYTSLNEQVLLDIQKAEELAEVVIVCPHWGTENSAVPSKYQEKFAKQMTEAGADLIIGTHPHVVQPVEWIQADNGNKSLCFYSLGNYASTQKGGRNMLEGLAWVTFRVTEEGVELAEEKTGILPLVCHYTSGPVRFKGVYLLEDYTQELAAVHGIIPYGGISFALEDLLEWNEETIGAWGLTGEQIRSFQSFSQ